MGRRKNDFDERVQERYDNLIKQFKEVDDLIADGVHSYCVVCEQLSDISETIRQQGYTISNNGNRKENPLVGTEHKLHADKIRFATWLKRMQDKQVEEAADDEEIAAFMGL